VVTKFQSLYKGNLIALTFLRDDAPGVDGLLGGIIPFGRTGSWTDGDAITLRASRMQRQTFPVGTTTEEAVSAMLTDAAIEPWKCVSFQYQ
jgi:hypothetical protein